MANRHLARPETLQLHPVLGFIEPGLEPRFKIRGRHDDLDLALQALGLGFRYLHSGYLLVCSRRPIIQADPQ